MKQYLEFDLSIEKLGDRYQARILKSPAGEATVSFSLPFSEAELDEFVASLATDGHRFADAPASSRISAEEFGGKLFDAVFHGAVLGCLQSSLTRAKWQNAGLRIRLRLSLSSDLIDLPWEYLYNATTNSFLSLSMDTPIVRYLGLPKPAQPLAVTAPLRLLVVAASPLDYPPLDVAAEWEKLRASVQDLEVKGRIVVDKLEPATLPALQRQLRRHEYHIFHFIGHGDYNQQLQDGQLLFENQDQMGHAVSGRYLSALLRYEPTLRLAILNACKAGCTDRHKPFAGMAQSLLQQGVPAVIAMQTDISDAVAQEMTHEFYAAVAEGYPVDAALTEARKAIYIQGN